MGFVHGRNMMVHLDGVAVAAAKSCTLSSSCELIEICSPASPTSREYIAGRKEWSIRVSQLVIETATFKYPLSIGKKYDISMVVPIREDNPSGYFTVAGKAILTKADITATVGNLCQGSIEFKGTGNLINAMNLFPSLMEGWEDDAGIPAIEVGEYELESMTGADLLSPPTRYRGDIQNVFSMKNSDAPASIKVYRSPAYYSIAYIISHQSPTTISKTGTTTLDGQVRAYYKIPSSQYFYRYIVINVGPYATDCQLEPGTVPTAFVGV